MARGLWPRTSAGPPVWLPTVVPALSLRPRMGQERIEPSGTEAAEAEAAGLAGPAPAGVPQPSVAAGQGVTTAQAGTVRASGGVTTAQAGAAWVGGEMGPEEPASAGVRPTPEGPEELGDEHVADDASVAA